MAINQKKYIDIVSGVGGAASAARRLLIARCMTTNVLAPTNQILELSLSQTLALFGSSSNEYKFAAKYFGFISKSITQAEKLSFARWPMTDDVAPNLISTITLPAYTVFAALTDTASVKVSLGGSSFDVAPDFTGDATLADVAASMQIAIRAKGTSETLGAMWTSSTFTYADGSFVLTGGVAGAASIGYMTAAAAEYSPALQTLLGMDVGSSPILSVGVDAETPVEAMARVDALSDNFGSFMFLDTLTNDEIVEVADWNKTKNYKYLYSVSTTVANASTLAGLLEGSTGTILTLDNSTPALVEFMPMSLFAATNYGRPNSVKTFMYQKFDSEVATVTTDTASDAYDALKVNYLGATQQAGQSIAFYQDGVMQDAGDVSPYCNEIWLKDAISTEFLNLLLALEMIPANETGAAIATNTIMTIIAEALNNGTVQAGKTLTNVQKAYITQVSGSEDAWRDIQSSGYWLNVVITTEVVNEVTKYIANYLLIYSKGDSIRKVEGSDILI